MKLLNQGALVALQENRWADADAGVWASQFPLAHVAAAPGRAGPGARVQGGVAVVLPRGLVATRQTVLVPGCCLEVVVGVAAPRGRGGPLQAPVDSL
eukprot:4559550-Alexandrium_andersonii.AAC.1